MKETISKSQPDFFRNSLVVGINDHLLCKDGWHERAVDGRFNFPYRPASAMADFEMVMPGGKVELVALMSAGVSLSGGIMTGKLRAQGAESIKFQFDTENWVIRKFTFDCLPEGPCRFQWITDNPFIPNDLLKNGDFRVMGVYLARIMFRQFSQSGGDSS